MDNIRVSVIIPTYRPGEYITKCLDSLCDQTLDSGLYEIVVILNGERAPYFDRLQTYAQSRSNHCLRILYAEHAGVSNARNMGIGEARGQYLVFIDDDDWVSSNYLENLLEKADDTTVVASNAIAIDEATGQETDYFLSKAYEKVSGMSRPSLFVARSFLSPPICKLIPRGVIAEHRFPTDFALGEDSIFMFTISCNIGQMRFTSADTVYYIRIRNNSASHRHYSYWFRVKLAMKTTLRYLRIYLSAPARYDFLFFLSRVAATLRKLFWKSYM